MEKSVFILAQDGDPTADDVVHWLRYLGATSIIRISDYDMINQLTIKMDEQGYNYSLSLSHDRLVLFTSIGVYWYRRGALSIPAVEQISYSSEINGYTELKNYYKEEWEHIADYIHFTLRKDNIPSLNSYNDLQVNKLIALDMAKHVGLDIPETIISNDWEMIYTFAKKHQHVILKSIRYPGFKFYKKGITVGLHLCSNLVNFKQLIDLRNNYPSIQPTLFQEYVEKDFEIRSYYMKGVIFSMAIFSQSNEKTKIDFRNYDEDTPNRNVPFLLPPKIEEQIELLMKRLNFDSGSIDLIYNNGKYVFLEVNTVGQLQWVSHHCNYYIEKHIANTLLHIKNDAVRTY